MANASAIAPHVINAPESATATAEKTVRNLKIRLLNRHHDRAPEHLHFGVGTGHGDLVA